MNGFIETDSSKISGGQRLLTTMFVFVWDSRSYDEHLPRVT